MPRASQHRLGKKSRRIGQSTHQNVCHTEAPCFYRSLYRGNSVRGKTLCLRSVFQNAHPWERCVYVRMGLECLPGSMPLLQNMFSRCALHQLTYARMWRTWWCDRLCHHGPQILMRHKGTLYNLVMGRQVVHSRSPRNEESFFDTTGRVRPTVAHMVYVLSAREITTMGGKCRGMQSKVSHLRQKTFAEYRC